MSYGWVKKEFTCPDCGKKYERNLPANGTPYLMYCSSKECSRRHRGFWVVVTQEGMVKVS